MPPKKADPKKDAKAQSKASKASSGGGGKAKKKKWSKGKNKEKVNNAILFDKNSYEKMLAEAPKFKMITISILSDRLRINCSLARRVLSHLVVRPRHALRGHCGRDCASRLSGPQTRPQRGPPWASTLNPLPLWRVAHRYRVSYTPLPTHPLQEKGMVREVVRHAKQARETRSSKDRQTKLS